MAEVMGRRPNRTGTVIRQADGRYQGKVKIAGRYYTTKARTFEEARQRLDQRILEVTGAPVPPVTATIVRGYESELMRWRRLRREVLERDDHRCHYCGGHATTVDHVVPLTADGETELHNLVAACSPCNGRKGNGVPDPDRLAAIIKEADEDNPEWARGARFVLGWVAGPSSADLTAAFEAVRDKSDDA